MTGARPKTDSGMRKRTSRSASTQAREIVEKGPKLLFPNAFGTVSQAPQPQEKLSPGYLIARTGRIRLL